MNADKKDGAEQARVTKTRARKKAAARPDETAPAAPEAARPRPAALALPSIGARASAPKAIGAHAANTIVYVHGIGNKPLASTLKCQWDTALFGAKIGDRSRMAYWVSRDYYPTPLDETCASADIVRIDDDEASTKAIMAVAGGEAGSDAEVIRREIQALAGDDANKEAFLTKLAARLAGNAATGTEASAASVSAKLLPVSGWLRRRIANRLTRALLRDVNDFLFDDARREAMERSFLDRLAAGGGPFVVIAHSQGSMIAYEVLRRLDPNAIDVPLFVTIGSPLGLQEVQDRLRDWSGGTLRAPACVRKWVNVADRLDVVALDATLKNDFEGGDIRDVVDFGLNLDSPLSPHSATGYLRTTDVRAAVRDSVGAAFEQAIAPFALAKDLVADLEDARPTDRLPALIQIAGTHRPDPASPKTLKAVGDAVEATIEQLVADCGGQPGDAQVERLRHFLSARLTRKELEVLRSRFADLKIEGVWRNARKRALIADSTNTVQAAPANLGYGADGRNICWAVLDTGIRADHPHFQKHGNVLAQWDCTRTGAPKRLAPGDDGFDALDGNGHGTHVAGVIAGVGDCRGRRHAGMAPRAALYGFKVLDDGGDGDDASIIKALDVIAALNDDAGELVVHGVNLSLGGAFDPSVFGCGHTPLCQELRRLWRQGVLVCLAAGNEGYAVLSTANGDIQANMDLSIGDPANLEETIAVGSVHKTNPHTYGVSFFSSRGPTADGRRKPDVVAPGERIVSARHDWKRALTEDDRYVEMSGTSMAAPHVSGVLAAFLSLRREFIGYPDRVKEILLAACVDLRRDPNMQGAGLPNLIKMLALH